MPGRTLFRWSLVSVVVLSALILLMPAQSGLGELPTSSGRGVLLPSDSFIERSLPPLSNGGGPSRGATGDCSPTTAEGNQCSLGASHENHVASSSAYWTNLTGPIAPPTSDYVGMTYDPIDHYVVLFGGLSSTGYPLNDTWTFENGTWTNISATAGPSPSARYGMEMTFDAADGYVLAFGGTWFEPCPGTGDPECDLTWSFVGGHWHPISTEGSTPPASVSIAYDASDSYVVATNGVGTWRYSGGVWAPFCGTNCSNFITGPGVQGTMAYDEGDGYVVLFGTHPCDTCGVSYASGSFTWKFLAGKWTNLTATAGTPPSPRTDAVMAYDGASASVLLFGGIGSSGAGDAIWQNDTWWFRDGSWSNLTFGTSPPGSYASGIAYDSEDAVIVLFGGDDALGSGGVTSQTWVWGASPPIGELVPSVSPSTPLPGSATSFLIAFDGGTSPFAFEWRFGDGGSSTTADPIHTFANKGFYQVRVWVNDSATHTQNATLLVHVYTPLSVSSLKMSPSPAALDQPVNFSVSATGGTPPYTYAWTFGDGGTGGNLSNITHVYTTNGPFVASVSVMDIAGATARAQLNVTIMLEALAGQTTVNQAAPFTVSFVGQARGGVPPYSYNWSFGDGSANSSLQDPTHVYSTSGDFLASLTVQDGKGARSSESIPVHLGVVTVSLGSPTAPISEYELIAGVAIAMAVSLAWVVDFGLRRLRLREAAGWIRELTREAEIPPKTER
jgi:PKD repeat protein